MLDQWQAGVISALQERYNLSSLDFVGASAGSLAATLAACDADMDLAMKLALDLCDTNEVTAGAQRAESNGGTAYGGVVVPPSRVYTIS